MKSRELGPKVGVRAALSERISEMRKAMRGSRTGRGDGVGVFSRIRPVESRISRIRRRSALVPEAAKVP
ncbi:MAG: hypothetical protein UY22_C0017G0008 [Candidatus Amesbacteria bacterium GW2011_GWC1_48_10]|uniref:Uncharacterized protein n=1 Tax=Candidatus Amesbacteria bacterium GW2011_GWC1_48_10 TaxID=1618365 RepID=A0A0G1UI04_9BACT|nr:MAG: hypothetical protein UY22_C0017G0008 [Candidatus Amesbacteria bacterium GW2011_GWC1_48_10]